MKMSSKSLCEDGAVYHKAKGLYNFHLLITSSSQWKTFLYHLKQLFKMPWRKPTSRMSVRKFRDFKTVYKTLFFKLEVSQVM